MMKLLGKFIFVAATASCLSLGFIPSTFAQRETESELPARETRAGETAEQLAAEAKARKVLEPKEEVTFEQVLADPDNLDLNFQFAKVQIQKGDLLGASSTLERILLVDPNRTKVRLLYAVVLFRLDNLHQAEVEFRALRELDLPSNIRREVNGYLRQIKLRRRLTRLSLRQSVAFQYDSNRNAAPSSKERLFADLRLPVTRQNGRQSDTSFLNITTVDLAQDLGFQAGHEFIGSFTFFLAEQTEQDPLDLEAFQQEYGFRLKSKTLNVTPTFFVHNILLSRETFMRSQGGSLALDRSFFNRLELYAIGRLGRQEFVNIEENQAAHERRGDQIDATLGMRYRIFDFLNLSTYYARIDKNAKEEYNAYVSDQVGLGLTLLPGWGQFVLQTIDYGDDRYEAPDLAIAGMRRHDNTLRLRTTYGAPLTFFLIGKILPGPLKDITLTVTYEYYRAFSNVTNYIYKNNKFQTMLTQRLEF